MTSQEISEFVNQPTPRKVSDKIFDAVTGNSIDDKRDRNYNCVVSLALAFIMIFLAKGFIGDILLDIGNRVTVQGSIIEMSRSVSRTGSVHYRSWIRFQTPDGVVETSCYVSRKRNIPGWGVIPETLSDPNLLHNLRLKEPFPVTIEYIPWRPSIARAVGTRSSYFSYFLNLIFAVIALVVIYPMFRQLRGYLRTKRLLRKGLFVTGGRVFKPEERRENLFSSVIRFFQFIDLIDKDSFTVQFTDQHGMKRNGSFTVSNIDYSMCMQWVNNVDCSVDLLYLPNQDKVLVTNMWY